MATKKKLLQAAAGSAGGAAALNVEDLFSTYVYEGNGSSQVIENGINLGQSNSGGGAYFTGADTNCVIVPPSSDFGFGTGDYTIEFFVFKTSDKNYNTYYDQRTASQNATTASPFIYSDSGGTLYFHVDGANRISGSGTNVATGAWTHVAVCRSSGSTKMFVNGTQIGSTFSDTINYVTPANNFSFGGSEEQSLYNVEGYMSNVRVVKGSALYTSNFTAPTSALTAVSGTVLLALQGDDPFTDNSSSGHALVNDNAKASTFGPFDAADAGEGGLVWIKDRSTTEQHVLTDTERGATKFVKSNSTGDEQTNAQALTSFNSNGFSIGNYADVNQNTDDFASWTFRKAPKFFTCLTYTGDGTTNHSKVITHNLGSSVGFIAVKGTTNTFDWQCAHKSLAVGQTLKLNATNAASGGDGVRIVDDTSFSVAYNAANESGQTYVAYLFAHNDGDGEFGPTGDQDIIKCGVVSHTQSNGFDSEVNLGFEPQWLLIKNSNNAGYAWAIFDTMRGWTVQTEDNYLTAESSDAEGTTSTGTGWIDVTPTGFKIQDAMFGTGEYIYIAIRRGPMAVPDDATDVFAIDTRDGSTPPEYTSGFPVDMALRKGAVTSTADFYNHSRLMGGAYLLTNTTGAEQYWSNVTFDYMNGYKDGSSVISNDYSWMWKRAPSFCDVVAYTGNGTLGRTVSHNLGVAPEMMWIKGRDDTENWRVFHSGLPTPEDDFLYLNSTNATVTNVEQWNSTLPTSTEFSLSGQGRGVNDSNEGYVAYLFASLDGVSKVGSYTGNGTSQNIDCGFSSGARFVLIKASSAAYGWMLFDTERGITSGNDSLLLLNDTDAETTAFDSVDPYSSGFTAVQGPYNVNQNGVSYIFYAIA